MVAGIAGLPELVDVDGDGLDDLVMGGVRFDAPQHAAPSQVPPAEAVAPSPEGGVEEAVITVESPAVGRAGDWRQAAQRIDAELAQYFNGPGPRH